MKKQLVILPGWNASKDSWQDFINLAQNQYEVICLELPCFGNEPCPEKIWEVADYAEFIKQKIIDLNLARPILLGHSFGGQIAVYLAANNQQLISKLILSGAAIIRPAKNLKRLVFEALAKTGKIIFKLPGLNGWEIKFKKILYRLADSPDYNNASGSKREIFKKVIRQDLRYLLPKINLPTLIIWGTKDSYVPLRYGKAIARLIKNSQLKIIPNGRHGLHLEQPANLLNIISEFIEN